MTRSKGKVDRKTIRAEQKELGINKSMSLATFRKAWVKMKGDPSTKREKEFLDGQGLKDFYEDYMTHKDSKNVWQYLNTFRR